jgi:hypothetical protein
MTVYRAPVNVVLFGSVEKDDELYHEVKFYEGENYDISLEAEDKEVDLDLYITDKGGNIIYEDESEDSDSAAVFTCGTTGTFCLYVKAVDGDTDYTLTVQEQDGDEEEE